jgi:hypothetical protein
MCLKEAPPRGIAQLHVDKQQRRARCPSTDVHCQTSEQIPEVELTRKLPDAVLAALTVS